MTAVREKLTPFLCADCRSRLTKQDKAKGFRKCQPCRDQDYELKIFGGTYKSVDGDDIDA